MFVGDGETVGVFVAVGWRTAAAVGKVVGGGVAVSKGVGGGVAVGKGKHDVRNTKSTKSAKR